MLLLHSQQLRSSSTRSYKTDYIPQKVFLKQHYSKTIYKVIQKLGTFIKLTKNFAPVKTRLQFYSLTRLWQFTNGLTPAF